MTWKPIILAALALAASPLAAEEPFLPQTLPIALDPADPSANTLGELTYRGGVVIEPGDEGIGRITGLDWYEGRLFAVTSDGRWLILTPDAIQNQLTDVIEAEIGDLSDPRGKRLSKSDTLVPAGVSIGEDGAAFVALEGTDGLLFYPSLTAGARPNLVKAQEGTTVYAPEPLVDAPIVANDCTGRPVCFHLHVGGGVEDGFATHVVATAALDGTREIVAQLPDAFASDRFSGLAIREDNGRTYLYLMSDNDGSDDQRTLLLKLEVSARAATTPGVAEKVFETVNVVLETELGEIIVSLETERAPITAANFLRYVDEGRFDGIKCYRAMKVEGGQGPSGFVQCGTQNDPKRILDPIAHEPTNETGLSHLDGALSMARFDPGSATGDFSIMIQDQIGLDAVPDSDDPARRPGFAVFGYVLNGMDTVVDIQNTPVDPEKGEGFLKGQLFAEPVTILRARRQSEPDD